MHFNPYMPIGMDLTLIFRVVGSL